MIFQVICGVFTPNEEVRAIERESSFELILFLVLRSGHVRLLGRFTSGLLRCLLWHFIILSCWYVFKTSWLAIYFP